MKTLVYNIPINYSNPQLSSSNLFFQFPSLSRENRKFIHNSYPKWLYNPKKPNFSSLKAFSASDSASYGGWDDRSFAGDSDGIGESDQFRNFLISIGIDDKKYVFMFILGLVCALGISRVRISSIVVFPASVLVFAIGFSFGFVRSGSISEVSVSGSKRKAKEEILRVYGEKLRSLVDFFDGFNVKVDNLKRDIRRAIDDNEITVNDLENYVEVVNSISLSTSNARNTVEAVIDNVGNSRNVLIENQKPSRKRKEVGEFGINLLPIIGGLFREKLVGSKSNKMKDNVKREIVENPTVMNDQSRGNIPTPAVEDANSGFSHDLSNMSALGQDGDRRIRNNMESKKISLEEMGRSTKRYIDSEEFSYRNSRLQFVNNQRTSLKMDCDNEAETLELHDNLLNSVDFKVSLKHMETEASFVQEQMLKKSSGDYRSSPSWKKNENETYRSRFREEGLNLEDDSHQPQNFSAQESEDGPSSSSTVGEDVMFGRHLTEATDLLKQARECIKSRSDEDRAEIILYKCAKLLSKAIAMKPMSLLAVGQLGNAYLLHGELKLKISRELRTLLSRSDPISVEKRSKVLKGLVDQVTSKDKVASILVNVCEECEELLVEAGRKYRMALSIDGNDVRALYNWGLALSFRAQLIADIGPEAASDADKVFLAAIDKFDAMMSRGNVYAPDALFRWGIALQHRSRLRPSDSKERVKLLQQAKRLYEDVLHMDSGNLQAIEALSSCTSELKLRYFQP